MAPRTTEEIMGHPNEAIVRKGYEAFSKGDTETLQNEIFTEDIVWHVPGRNRLSGDYSGISEVLGYFGQLGELSAGSLQVTLEDVLANDERTVALHHATGTSAGKTLDDHEVLVFHFRGDKVSEARAHTENQHAVDQFWS
ncbi:MAG: nuclear transport factor 2 family protein [Acidimicrobiia bacterium]